MNPTKSKYLRVGKSNIHNSGAFASQEIKEGTKIIQYVGEKISKKEGTRRSDLTLKNSKNDNSKGSVYIFELNKKYDIDGNVEWNTARHINHSCNPNCEVGIIDGKIWIIAKREIKKDEEITYNYGYDVNEFEEHPCKCGSKNCIGFIISEDHKNYLKERLLSLT